LKALKFLSKALIAALGICVIVGALNYSGFSFSDLKWLSKDEMVQNFVQEEFNDCVYYHYDTFYAPDKNLSFNELIYTLDKIFKKHMDTKTFSLFDDLNSTIGLNKITNKITSNKIVPWNFVDFVHHHTDRNVDINGNYSYTPFEGNKKINYDLNQTLIFTCKGGMYGSDSFSIKECKNITFFERALGKNRYCIYYEGIKYMSYKFQPSEKTKNPDYEFDMVHNRINQYLQGVKECVPYSNTNFIHSCEFYIDNHGNRYYGNFYLIYSLIKTMFLS